MPIKFGTKAHEIAMYGCTEAAIKTMYKDTIYRKTDPDHGGCMLVMAILSDAQEALDHGDAESNRQFINKAKYLIHSKLQDAQED